MLSWINKQGAESSKGFKVQRMSRFYYNYIEGDRVMVIDVEPGLLYEEITFNSSKWEKPFDTEAVGHEKIEIIRLNLSEALRFMNIAYRFK